MKKYFSKLDKPLLITTIIFFVFGLIMIQSASSMESYMRYDYSPYHYFIRQLLFLFIGLFAFIFTIIFPTKNYRKLYITFFVVAIISLLGLFFVGYSANQAVSWYKFGPITIQPSEFAKVLVIIALAAYYDKNKDRLDSQKYMLIPLFFVGGICVPVIIQPDLGTAIIIGLLALFIFYAVPTNKKNKKLFTNIILLAVVVVTIFLFASGSKILKPYQLERFNYFDPCERYTKKTGYQLCNSLIAFKNGGLRGQGLGGSTQKYLYLPESYTDFIFPIIVEEWGLIIGIVIIVGYMFILFRILKIARGALNVKNNLICYGVFIYLFLHIMINLFGVMGVIPITGVPLPFLSYGGSYTMCLFIALGLVQRVAIETNNHKIQEKVKN